MGACELKRQAKLEHWKMQIIDCRSSGMSVRGWHAEHNISTGTYYRWEKEEPFVGSHGTCAHSLSTAAACSFCRTPIAARAADRRQSDCQHPNWERESGHLFGCGCGCGEGNLPGTEIMLRNFTRADKVYISPAAIRICGKGSMGWRLWCSNSFSWTHSPIRCFCSAADGGTASRDSTGSGMDSSCCISGWNRARTNGRERKMKRGS